MNQVKYAFMNARSKRLIGIGVLVLLVAIAASTGSDAQA